LFVGLLLPVAALMRSASRGDDALPDFGMVPSFTLVDQRGAVLTPSKLAGTPWFADFVYTHCEGSCPVLSGEMSRLQRRVGDRARLVSFSVDPARDTPEALTAYAQRFAASPGDWLFVGGEVGAMRELIRQGFHLAVLDADPRDGQPAGAIAHSEKIVLVDAKLRIRRYYDGGDGRWIDDALRDLNVLGAATEAHS